MENETQELAESTPDVSQEVTATGDTYTVKVDGEMQQVSLDELQNGYQRQADSPVKRKSWHQNAKGWLKERQSSKH